MTKPRILIVEDEPGIADTLQYALRTDGFEPAWVATGEEAIAEARARPPALVILDVGLPEASGFEAEAAAGADLPQFVRDEFDAFVEPPYDGQPGRERFAEKRPDWARQKAGCSRKTALFS